MKLNNIYQEDCFVTMDRLLENGIKPNIILTSPPYNTARTNCNFINDTLKGRYTARYLSYNDMLSDKEYSDWTISLFTKFNEVLEKNGVILYNINYGTNTHESFYHLLSDIQRNTPFTIADQITWKKKTAVPNTASPNKLTRITEPIFVLVRKEEYRTFQSNKMIVSYSKGTNQKNYENILNFIEAANNDGSCPIHKATYSSELCCKLLEIYALDNSLVYDPFIGTGTTAVACRQMGLDWIGSEISDEYVEYANKRLNEQEFKNR